MRKIRLSKNKYALVDDEDFDKLSFCFVPGIGYVKNSWSIRENRGNYYACMGDNKKNLLMHRVIMNAPKGKICDHINGNGLDNRKSNLRICTNKDNVRNQKLSKKNTSGHKGVGFIKKTKKWVAHICVNNKKIYLGCFKNKIMAAQAYRKAAKKYFGEFARFR